MSEKMEIEIEFEGKQQRCIVNKLGYMAIGRVIDDARKLKEGVGTEPFDEMHKLLDKCMRTIYVSGSLDLDKIYTESNMQDVFSLLGKLIKTQYVDEEDKKKS